MLPPTSTTKQHHRGGRQRRSRPKNRIPGSGGEPSRLGFDTSPKGDPSQRTERHRLYTIGRGHTPSSHDLGSILAGDDDSRHGRVEEDPSTAQPQDSQPPPYSCSKRSATSLHRGDEPPRTSFSPLWTRRRSQSGAPTGRGRIQKDLFRGDAGAAASPSTGN